MDQGFMVEFNQLFCTVGHVVFGRSPLLSISRISSHLAVSREQMNCKMYT